MAKIFKSIPNIRLLFDYITVYYCFLLYAGEIYVSYRLIPGAGVFISGSGFNTRISSFAVHECKEETTVSSKVSPSILIFIFFGLNRTKTVEICSRKQNIFVN